MTMVSWEKLTKNMANAVRTAYKSDDAIDLIDLPEMITGLYTKKPTGNIYFSNIEPTATDGNDNDIWVVI